MESIASIVTAISESVKNLYEKFFLRDILGKFIPGLIITFCICTLLFEPSPGSISNTLFDVIKLKHDKLFGKESDQMFSFLAWMTFISISYVIGFCNQTISEIVGIQSAHPYPKESIFHDKLKGHTAREQFHTRLDIMKSDQTTASQKAQRERYVVIKEMSGNMVIPFIFISGFSIFNNWVLALMFLFLSMVSLVTHIFHRDRQFTFEERTITRIKSNAVQEIK